MLVSVFIAIMYWLGIAHQDQRIQLSRLLFRMFVDLMDHAKVQSTNALRMDTMNATTKWLPEHTTRRESNTAPAQ